MVYIFSTFFIIYLPDNDVDYDYAVDFDMVDDYDFFGHDDIR